MSPPLFLTTLIILFVLSALPWMLALLSKKTSGNKKVIWFLLSFFLSWLGFIIYYFVVVRPEWKANTTRHTTKRMLRNENGMPIKMYEEP